MASNLNGNTPQQNVLSAYEKLREKGVLRKRKENELLNQFDTCTGYAVITVAKNASTKGSGARGTCVVCRKLTRGCCIMCHHWYCLEGGEAEGNKKDKQAKILKISAPNAHEHGNGFNVYTNNSFCILL